jgi:hypothetical protein
VRLTPGLPWVQLCQSVPRSSLGCGAERQTSQRTPSYIGSHAQELGRPRPVQSPRRQSPWPEQSARLRHTLPSDDAPCSSSTSSGDMVQAAERWAPRAPRPHS